MGIMNIPGISESLLKSVLEHARKTYPHECCGMILGPAGQKEKLSRFRPCKNVQDLYHEKDPVNFPRTAKTAYFIEPRELLAIQKEARSANEEIRIIYHSHNDAGAYFSDEDKRIALCEGEPAYPGVEYLVVSVIAGEIKDCRLFHWDPARKDFSS